MPIRFRCEHCQTLMSIATRKAGQQVQCPACDLDVRVPLEDQVEALADELPHPIALPPAEPVPAPDQLRVRDQHDEPDRVALPDDLFEFEPEPVAAEKAWAEPAVEDALEFTSYQDPWTESPLPAGAASPPIANVELPPLRSRTEETPEAFTLPIRKSGIDDEMDLTPMVDVVFQLLIFFMVTASFALHKTIQTPSPDPDQKGATQSIQSLDELEGVAILVRIDGQNAITIDDDPLPDGAVVADALQAKMRAEQKSEIIITADAAAWHRTVVKVVDAANAVGMQKIRLATRSGPAE